jgi:PcaR/PcaU/PobR family beta-ketoadipate pathway transcriptional regulator
MVRKTNSEPESSPQAVRKAGPRRGADDQEAQRGIQSVARALGILELFSEHRPALSAVEIAELTGLNRGTAYRFCQTLRALGYLEDVGARRFRPGLKAVSLAQAALAARELPELAMPYLRELQRATGETVNMAMLDGAEIVYVARVLSDSLITLRLFVGSRLPAYATSLGRSMLAFLPDEQVEERLARSDLKALTERTMVDPRELMVELGRIRTRGYAVNDQELALGLRGVAAPVFAASGRPVAAINISLPRPIDRNEIEASLAPRVTETADAISQLVTRLGVEAPRQ